MESWIPHWLASLNWFLASVPLVALLHCLVLRSDLARSRPAPLHRRLSQVAAAAMAVALVLGTSLELYLLRGCPNSSRFRDVTHSTAVDAFRILNDLSLRHWLMFGNILFVLRGRTDEVPPSDTDVDVAVLASDLERDGTLASLAERLDAAGYGMRKVPGRALYQVQRRGISLPGPRFDVWVYSNSTVAVADDGAADDGAVVPAVENRDYTVRDQRMPADRIFPLRPATYLNQSTYVPRDAELVSRLEYGANYMTPVSTRLECVQNVTNGYCFYDDLALRGAFVASATAAVVVVHRFLLRWLDRPPVQRGKKWDGSEV